MLKSRRSLYSLQTFGFDLVALFVAFVVSWALRDSLGNLLLKTGDLLGYSMHSMVRNPKDLPPIYQVLLSSNPLVGFHNFLWLFFIGVPPWIFFLNAQNGYDFQSKRNSRQQFAICAYAGMLGTVALVVLLYLMNFKVSRILLLNWMLLGILCLWASRTFLVPLLQRNRRGMVRNLIVIGSRAATENFVRILESPAYRGAQMLGYITDTVPEKFSPDGSNSDESSTRIDKFRWLGALSNLPNVLD